ncbi:hypothetical protein [Parafrankia sp. FMc2]|uniref:hypothetical protein n=1 Tax=Parafrankia sp. FMc2 TaxID=3233196 RepID=UPI0034D41188
MDGTLIPTGTMAPAAPSKHHRYSTNPRVAVDAGPRLVIALGDPRSGNGNDPIVYQTSGIADHPPDGPYWPTGATKVIRT